MLSTVQTQILSDQSVVRQLFQIPSIGQGESNVLLSKMHRLSQLYLCWKTVNTILQMLHSIQHSLKWLTASASQRPRTELAWTLHYLVLKKPPPCHREHNLREPILCGDFDCIAAPFRMYFMKVRDTAFSVLGFHQISWAACLLPTQTEKDPLTAKLKKLEKVYLGLCIRDNEWLVSYI